MLAALLSVARAARLTAGADRRLVLDSVPSPFILKAVLYSPTPWGYDEDMYYQSGAYATDYAAMFNRDLALIVSLGANAVRIHGFMGVTSAGGQHTAFLDAAANLNLVVLLSYELMGTGDRAVRLATSSERALAIADLRYFVRAARHPAVGMLVLGEALNRGDAGYVCHDSGTATLGCQFSEDIDSFADGLPPPCHTTMCASCAPYACPPSVSHPALTRG